MLMCSEWRQPKKVNRAQGKPYLMEVSNILADSARGAANLKGV